MIDNYYWDQFELTVEKSKDLFCQLGNLKLLACL